MPEEQLYQFALNPISIKAYTGLTLEEKRAAVSARQKQLNKEIKQDWIEIKSSSRDLREAWNNLHLYQELRNAIVRFFLV